MIRHVAVLRFVPEFTEGQRDEWIALLLDLPNHIPQIRAISAGKNVVPGPAAHEVAIVADFDSVADLQTYSTHPAHQRLVDISGPVKASLAVVDFEIDG
ncbi:Dabb family protein [Homoserinimonas sp. A447]